MLQSRDVDDRVAGDDRVERRVGEIERRHVRLDEVGIRHELPCQLDLRLRDVHAGHVVMSAEDLRDGNPGSTPGVEHMSACPEPRDQLVEQPHVLAVKITYPKIRFRDRVVASADNILSVNGFHGFRTPAA